MKDDNNLISDLTNGYQHLFDLALEYRASGNRVKYWRTAQTLKIMDEELLKVAQIKYNRSMRMLRHIDDIKGVDDETLKGLLYYESKKEIDYTEMMAKLFLKK